MIWYVLESIDINDLAHACISNACLCILWVRDTAAKSFFTTISHNVKFLKGYSFKIGGNNYTPASNLGYLAPPPGQFFMGAKLFIGTPWVGNEAVLKKILVWAM